MNLLNEILKDKELKKIVDTLSEEELEDNLLTLFQQKKENEICANCQGKSVCQMDPEYMQTYLVKNGPILSRNNKDCKYKPQNIHYLYMPSYTKEGELFTNEKRTDILKKMTEAMKGGKGIYLHGSFGCGKTFLMMRLAEKIKQDREVYFVYYPELVNKVKACIARGDNSLDVTLDVIKNAEVLFLDDIGREQNTVYNRDQILGVILQYRCMNNLQTFMTSNYNIKMLDNHLANTKENIDSLNSKGIIERIISLMNVVELNDKSYR